MIEDALKTTRTLHRLILSVSLVVMVFALSVSLPELQVRQRDQVRALLGFDFGAYDDFVQSSIDAFVANELKQRAQTLDDAIDNLGHLVFETDEIGAAFGRPVHVGRLRVSETVLSDPGSARLAALSNFDRFPVDRDVQIVLARTDGVAEEVDAYLRRNARTGLRVSGVRVSLDRITVEDRFIDPNAVQGSIYFELVEAVQRGGAPVFSAGIECEARTIEGSSFSAWLENNAPQGVVSVTHDGLAWLPELEPRPEGFADKALRTLEDTLSEMIRGAGPEERSVSILGMSVPGSLALYAAPLTLLALSYYLHAHVGHLVRLIDEDENSDELAHALCTFAWMPLAHRRRWRVEAIATTGLLPCAALIVAWWRLLPFGEAWGWRTFILVGCAAVIGVYCWATLGGLQTIRKNARSSFSARGEVQVDVAGTK